MLHLCLGINALQCSLYTGLGLFSSYPLEVHPPRGSWRLLRCLPGNYSNSPAQAWREGRQVHLVSWLQGTWIRQKAKGQEVMLLLWSPSSQPSLLSRDQTSPSSPSPASGMFSQHLSGTIKDRACQNQGSVFNIIMTAVETVNITQTQREETRTSWDKCWERRPTLHFFLSCQEFTRTHLFPS